jgi:hypothetical protein
MELLPLTPRHIDRNSSSLTISADDLNNRLLAQSKYRMFRRSYFPAAHTQEDIARLNARNGGRSSRVNILKDRSLPVIRVVRQIGHWVDCHG